MAAKTTRRRTKKWPKIPAGNLTASEILASLNLTERDKRFIRAAVDKAERTTAKSARPKRRATAKQ